MFSHHLHATPADIIMKAAVKLEETNIYKCFSSRKEVNDWYNILAETPIMNLERLDIHEDISDVSADVLANAVVRVEDVRSENEHISQHISGDQYLTLFNMIASSKNLSSKL